MSWILLVFKQYLSLFRLVGGLFAISIELSEFVKSGLTTVFELSWKVLQLYVTQLDLFMLCFILIYVIVSTILNLVLQFLILFSDLELFLFTFFNHILKFQHLFLEVIQLILVITLIFLHFSLGSILDVLSFKETFLCADIILF